MHVPEVARSDVRVMKAATALTGAGLDVRVVDIERDRTRPKEELSQGVPIRHSRVPRWLAALPLPWAAAKGVRVCLGMLKVLPVAAEVYHAHDVLGLPACYLAASLHHKPLIYDAHELPLVDPSLTRRRLLHAVSVRLVRRMVRRCTAVIVVSEPIAGAFQRLYGGPEPVVVRNIPVYEPPVASDRLREALGIGPETCIALYQGGLNENRSLDLLVRAARFLDPNMLIVLMGDGGMQPELERLITAEGVGDRVRIIPSVPHRDLIAWTASADLGLIAYRPGYSLNVRYCLPNKIFEYCMAGVPVLASQLNAVAAVIRRYDVGAVVESEEPEAVGRAILGLLSDVEGRARMRRNGLAAARAELRWEVERERLIALYERVLGATAPHSRGAIE
jgi:glycosyltransferase involved in cell wall biosynthesis